MNNRRQDLAILVVGLAVAVFFVWIARKSDAEGIIMLAGVYGAGAAYVRKTWFIRRRIRRDLIRREPWRAKYVADDDREERFWFWLLIFSIPTGLIIPVVIFWLPGIVLNKLFALAGKKEWDGFEFAALAIIAACWISLIFALAIRL